MDGVRSGKTRGLVKSTINRHERESAEEICGVALEVSEHFLLHHALQPGITLARIVAAACLAVCALECWSEGKNSISWRVLVVPILAALKMCQNKRVYGTRY